MSQCSARSLAEWIPEERRALVLTPRGTRISRFGSNVRSAQWLAPEEVLFLLEERALVLLIGGEPASARDAFSAIVDSSALLRRSTAFAHMYHLGYICRASREPPAAADAAAAVAGRLRADFDVFDTAHFRRSAASSGALPPRLRLLVVGNTNALPPFGLLRELAQREPAPLTIAVVSGSDVSLLRVEAGELEKPARRGLWATAAALAARAPRLAMLGASACATIAVVALSRRARR